MDAFLGLDPSNKDKLKRSQDQKKSKEEADKKEIKLWIEKYRPKSLDEIVFQDNVVNALKKNKRNWENAAPFILWSTRNRKN